MFQTIDGIDVFVIVLSEDPTTMLPITSPDAPSLVPYAQALDAAIREGVVKEPGKYGISITDSGQHWNVFKIIE